jgi:DNA-binding ferritin-like protein
MNDINTYISQNISVKESTIKEFSIYLCDILSSFKILHWYSKDYNFHKLIGKFYNEFDELFDELMEEIIGVSKEKNINFSVICPERDIRKINDCLCLNDQIEEVFNILDSLQSTIKNKNMEEFVSVSINGINNIIEEINSASNKLKYLLSMFNTEDQKTTLIPLKDFGV